MSTAEELHDQHARTAASTLLSESAFIEAGAGTGKSTTLVERILNTLMHPDPLPITSIAAITFTDRAGAELRYRLREKVTKRLAKGTDSPADRQLLSAALQDLDAAVIGTIHSFAQRILRTHALSAGLPLAFAPATGADAADDERSRVRSAIEHVQASLDPGALSLLAAYGLAPVDLLEVLARLDAQGLRLCDAAFSQGGADLNDLCAATADEFESFLLGARADCGDPADR
ncbi:MAG: UvrD-helicase domain-containing protein, partial [Candidatus Nanopelagicales bacterium]